MKRSQVKKYVMKRDLDRRVEEMLPTEWSWPRNFIAREVEKDIIRVVTRHFCQEIVRALAESGAVHLEGVGTLRVGLRNGKRTVLTKGTFKKGEHGKTVLVEARDKQYVSFTKASALTKALKRAKQQEERS